MNKQTIQALQTGLQSGGLTVKPPRTPQSNKKQNTVKESWTSTPN